MKTQSATSASIGPSHAHYFQSVTNVTMNHSHSLKVFTYPVNGNGIDGHFHRYQGITDMQDGHFHWFTGHTGPAILLPDGSHVHAIFGETDDEPFIHLGNNYETILTIPRHTHRFSGRTGPGLGYEPEGW